MRQVYGRDIDDGNVRLVRRRPLHHEAHDWYGDYGPSDVVPYSMPHRTRIDEVQRPDKWTPRAHVRNSRSVDAYPPAMPPPPHFTRPSADLYGRRRGPPVYEEDDDSDERWTRPRTRVRTPERVRDYRKARKPREPSPELISPPSSSETEEDSEDEDSKEDEIEVVVEEEDDDEEEEEYRHRSQHERRRRVGHGNGMDSQPERRHRGRHRMPSPATSDEMEISRLRASSERRSPARRPPLRREVSDDARLGPLQRHSSVIEHSRPPVASRRTNKVYETVETVREIRPHRSQVIQTTRQSSRRPSSNRGSHYEDSSRDTSPSRPAQLRDCKGCLDEVPASRCPRLDCGHRMCHVCLKRRFKQAIADPKQMPPTCCSPNHIPLEYVDKLFDMPFKKLWNRRFADYAIENRLYCPSRRCGEWIRPGNIYRDRETDRPAARCEQCDTKVCVTCNGRWHISRKCPRDIETERFLEYVRNEHLKRCYRCGEIAELKESRNRMICRCGAEFCMVCGHKPKKCDCPWFSYDAPSPERPERINIVVPRGGADRRPQEEAESPRRKLSTRGYTRQSSAYGEQAVVRQEEAMARNPQYYHAEDDLNQMGDHGPTDDYSRRAVGAPSASRPGYEMGLDYPPEDQHRIAVRGSMERGMADRLPESHRGPAHGPPSFVRAIDQGMMAPPMGMPPPVRGGLYGEAGGHHERVIVEREPSHYDDDDSYYSHSSRSRRGTRRGEPRKDSELAGLSGRGSGMGRVDIWRKFVEPGDPDGELAAAAAASASA